MRDATSDPGGHHRTVTPMRQRQGSRTTTTFFNRRHLMADDKNNTGSPDRDRINVNQDHELKYWTKTLGVTAEELRAAVKAVGPTSSAVRKHFGK
jgi:hypothetical protein